MACTKEHPEGDLSAAFRALPESQGKSGRHKCAACAYELGRQEGGVAEDRLRKRVQQLLAEVDQLKVALQKKGQ